MNYYKRHIGDYHKKAGRLSMLEHGAYTLLLDACYDREKFPTKDEAIDWCWARSAEEVAAVEFVLSKFFTLDGEKYVQTTIAENVAAYHENALKNKQIAIEREEARRLKREQAVHEATRTVHESPPNHKPLTTNHKPLTSIKENNLVDSAESTVMQKDDFLTGLFDKFWLHYKTKQGKQQAQKAFARFMKGKPEGKARFWMNLMLAYYMDCRERQVVGYDALHASSYINQKRWEDSPEFMASFKAEWIADNE